MSFDGAADLQFYCNTIWYQQWILPAVIKPLGASVAKSLAPVINHLYLFGEIAFAFKLVLTLNALYSHLQLREHLAEDGTRKVSRRPIKALLSILDLGVTTAASITYFALNSPASGPLFICMAALNLIKALYSLAKNIFKFQRSSNGSLQSTLTLLTFTPGLANNNETLGLLRHQAKIKKSLFDVGIAVLAIGCTALWVTCPLPAVVCLLLLAVVQYYGRKPLKAKSQAIKQSLFNLQQNSPPRQRGEEEPLLPRVLEETVIA